MRQTLQVCLLAGLMALCLVKAAAAPVEGTWEGTTDGVKSATVTVRERDGILGGSVIFYIIRDEGSGKHTGAPTPPLTMMGTQWDGSVLRFSVNAEKKSVFFEMHLTGESRAELTRLAQNGEPEMRAALVRSK